MKWLSLILLFSLSSAATAQSTLPTEIGGARFGGAANPVEASQASFTLGLTRDNGGSWSESADLAETIRIVGTINPEPEHLGRTADIFIVDRANLKFTMKDLDGNFLPWNGRVPDLVPALESVPLTASTEVEVFNGKLGAAGDHRIFLGYMVDGGLRYTPVPLRLEILNSENPGAFLSLSSSEADLVPGKIISFDYQGPAIAQEDLRIQSEERNIAGAVQNNVISFMIPPDLEGTAVFDIYAGGESFQYTAEIGDAPAIAEPENYLRDILDQALANWTGDGSGYFEEEHDDLRELQEQLGSFTESELNGLAILVKQNLEPLLSSGSAAPVLANGYGLDPFANRMSMFLSAEACSQAGKDFVVAVAEVIANHPFILVALAMGAVFIEEGIRNKNVYEGGIGVIIIGLSAYKIKSGMDKAEAGVEKVFAACIEALEADLLSKFGRAKVLEAAPKLSLDSSEAQEIEISITKGFFDKSLRNEFLINAAKVRAVIEEINEEFAKGTLDSLIERFPATDLSQETAKGSAFNLAGISAANIDGAVTASSGTSLTLEFSFADPAKVPDEGYEDFSFHLASNEYDLDLVVSARLYAKQPELSVSSAGAVRPNIAGVAAPTESQLLFHTVYPGQGPLEIPLSVSNVGTGPITLDAAAIAGSAPGFALNGPGGVLAPEQSQAYTLTYTLTASSAANRPSTSKGPAAAATVSFGQAGAPDFDYQVGVRVLLSYAGSYEITSAESSSEEGCANPDSTFPVAVSALNGVSQHQASFAGNLIDFSWNAQGGISASQQLIYEEDEGMVKDNLSVSIDITGKVSGSSSWTWTSDDGEDSCSGTTSISGTRIQ